MYKKVLTFLLIGDMVNYTSN